jgi:hypothetical protein
MYRLGKKSNFDVKNCAAPLLFFLVQDERSNGIAGIQLSIFFYPLRIIKIACVLVECGINSKISSFLSNLGCYKRRKCRFKNPF